MNIPANFRSRFRITHSASWGSAQHKVVASAPTEEAEEGECSSDEDEESTAPSESLLSAAVIAQLGGKALRMCAIDCEMCTTEVGLELTRISIVSPEISSFVRIHRQRILSLIVVNIYCTV